MLINILFISSISYLRLNIKHLFEIGTNNEIERYNKTIIPNIKKNNDSAL
jgi:hypothetical protein